MNNTISEMMNTVEGIKSWYDEAEDHITEMKDKVQKKNTQKEQEKEKRLRKN